MVFVPALVYNLLIMGDVISILTEEQEAFVEEELGNALDFGGDDIAAELGIPSRAERDWTDEEIETIWAEIERRWKPFFVHCVLNT